MALISCTTGAVALYSQADGSTLAVLVEAWDEAAGTPYVAGSTHLVAAGTLPGFVRLEQASTVIPARETPKEPVRVPVRPRHRPGVREDPL